MIIALLMINIIMIVTYIMEMETVNKQVNLVATTVITLMMTLTMMIVIMIRKIFKEMTHNDKRQNNNSKKTTWMPIWIIIDENERSNVSESNTCISDSNNKTHTLIIKRKIMEILMMTNILCLKSDFKFH